MPYKDKNKQRAYQLEWMHRRRNEYFADKACDKCGSIENLQLHHKSKATKVEHRIWSWSKERRERELKKCIVLCTLCHMRLHKAKPTCHGTVTEYGKGCRCDRCKIAQRDYMRIYRSRRPY